jgi:hypothetical protein
VSDLPQLWLFQVRLSVAAEVEVSPRFLSTCVCASTPSFPRKRESIYPDVKAKMDSRLRGNDDRVIGGFMCRLYSLLILLKSSNTKRGDTSASEGCAKGHDVTGPWVPYGLMGAFRAWRCWMQALSKLALSKACPFMALNVVIAGLLFTHLFSEFYTVTQAVGTTLVVSGALINGLG